MTTKHHELYLEDYDDYIAATPLEARFDPATIQIAVTEAFPKHEAYGMMFADYHRKRSSLQGYDDSEKKRLSFRFPSYFAHVATDIALLQKVSFHRAVILLVELGLIHFQVDYREEYHDIQDWRLNSFKKLATEESLRNYKKIERYSIVLESSSRSNPQFTPSVPDWLYNAIMEIKAYLNMSATDLIFFCWCYGCVNCFEDGIIPNIVREDMQKTCSEFHYEIQEYQHQINAVGTNTTTPQQQSTTTL